MKNKIMLILTLAVLGTAAAQTTAPELLPAHTVRFHTEGLKYCEGGTGLDIWVSPSVGGLSVATELRFAGLGPSREVTELQVTPGWTVTTALRCGSGAAMTHFVPNGPTDIWYTLSQGSGAGWSEVVGDVPGFTGAPEQGGGKMSRPVFEPPVK